VVITPVQPARHLLQTCIWGLVSGRREQHKGRKLLQIRDKNPQNNPNITLLFFAEIVTETFPVVLVLVAVDAEILPVGAVCGVISGIPVLVVHR
jgi:hypothetical protein